MNAKSDLPQGTLDLLILKIVALGSVHGYAIAQRLQQVSRDVVQVPQGSLYPALHRLENRGLLAADWQETETISEITKALCRRRELPATVRDPARSDCSRSRAAIRPKKPGAWRASKSAVRSR